MHPLTVKLFRDLRRLWAQSLAIALVMAAGVATLILGVGAHKSLYDTRAAYTPRTVFADVFANVTRAPNSITASIEAIDGVAAVEPRIVKIALADVEGMAEPASVMLVSLPDHHEPVLNRLYLRQGRMPEPGSTNQAVVSEGFAKAHSMRPGDSVNVLLDQRRDAKGRVSAASRLRPSSSTPSVHGT